MPSKTSSLSCQVDGLLRIYTYDERHIFLEFENQEDLQKASKVFMQYIIDTPMLNLISSIVPEYANFTFCVSIDIINPDEGLPCLVSRIIATETSLRRDIPIVPITREHLIYKG